MEISQRDVERLNEILEAKKEQKMVLIAHTNPDGDAIGSTLAWSRILRQMGHSTHCIAPNNYPYTLSWVEGIEEYIIFKHDVERATQVLNEADVIFCMDFNTTSRLEALGEALEQNTTAKRVLIDHHLNPDQNFDVTLSYPEESSTCFVTFSLIDALVGAKKIDKECANLLFMGMLTDTGNFSFAKLSPELFRAVATLVEQGVDIPYINRQIFQSYSENRVKLFGYMINRKLRIIEDGTVAYMDMHAKEMREHNFQQGDSEGFVNYPLSIKKLKISALFTEHYKFIRVSLRSRENIDVNEFARRYFNGGGHKNAAGGKSFVSMKETIENFKTAIAEYAAEGKI